MTPTEQQQPAAGGSYERSDDGALTRQGGTEPAPDRAAPEPDGQGSARPVDESPAEESSQDTPTRRAARSEE